MTRRPTRAALPIGVVTSEAMLTLGAVFSEPPPTSSLAAYELACSRGLSQLWFDESAVGALGLPGSLPRRGQVRHPWFNCKGSLDRSGDEGVMTPWLTCWRSNAPMVELSFAVWDTGSPFHALAAEGLLGELEEFRAATGVLWRRSGAITSDSMLREQWGGKLVSTEQVEPRPGMSEEDLIWSYEPDSEDRARFVHGFDLNGMYLSAASSLALPYGELRHVEADPHSSTAPHPGRPGWWTDNYSEEGRWITTPTACYRGLRYSEGWYWPSAHRFLEQWYRTLRDARAQLIEYGPSPALEAVKQVYRQGVGRFGSSRRSMLDDPLYQPYWRQAVIAEARTRLQRRIEKLPLRPCAVDVDCLYFLTSKGPESFAKSVGLPLGDGLGEFKVKGSARAIDARAILGRSSAIPALRELIK